MEHPMADKPTLTMKITGKKTGKDDKFTIDEKAHPELFAALKDYFEANPDMAGIRVRIEGRDQRRN
jgi:hypothetical protein